MRSTSRFSGLTLALVIATGLLTGVAGPAQAVPPATGQGQLDPPATYTTTIVVQDLDAQGHVVATQTISRPPQAVGTPQRIKGSAPPLLDTGVGGLPSATGCRTLTVTNRTSTLLGFTAFRFITETSWCWNLKLLQTNLSSVQVRIADVDAQFRYRGLNSSFNQTIDNGKRVYRQGFFENCVVKYGCIGAYYPSNDSRVYASGMWSWSTNG
jgi:hypothetical protein